jgi:hypothetical protein
MTHSCTVRVQCARITERSGRGDFSKFFAIRKKLVDVIGFEPATPCLQSRYRNAMLMARLALFCVLYHRLIWFSAAIGPKLDPR